MLSFHSEKNSFAALVPYSCELLAYSSVASLLVDHKIISLIKSNPPDNNISTQFRTMISSTKQYLIIL